MTKPKIADYVTSDSFVDFIRLLIAHWAFCLSAGYIYLTAIGMTFSYLSLRNYGINVFDYAGINDFLLAAFHDPLPILSGILTVTYSGISLVSIRRFLIWRKKVKIVLPKVMYINALIAALISPFIINFLIEQDDLWKHSPVILSPKDSPEASIKGELVGSTERFLFVNSTSNTITAIPIDNILRIEHQSTSK